MQSSGMGLEDVSAARVDQASTAQRGEDRREDYSRGDPFRPGGAAEGRRHRWVSPFRWARFQYNCRRLTFDSYHGNG